MSEQNLDIDKIIAQRDLCFRMEKARKAYGLSARNMSWILGFGVNQWRLYETAQTIPDQVHQRLIDLVFNPYLFYEFLRNPPEGVKNHVPETKLSNAAALCGTMILEIDQEINKLARETKDKFINKLFR